MVGKEEKRREDRDQIIRREQEKGQHWITEPKFKRIMPISVR